VTQTRIIRIRRKAELGLMPVSVRFLLTLRHWRHRRYFPPIRRAVPRIPSWFRIGLRLNILDNISFRHRNTKHRNSVIKEIEAWNREVAWSPFRYFCTGCGKSSWNWKDFEVGNQNALARLDGPLVLNATKYDGYLAVRRAIAQAVSRQLPTAAARVWAQVS
jgi:hypothetical protein